MVSKNGELFVYEIQFQFEFSLSVSESSYLTPSILYNYLYPTDILIYN